MTKELRISASIPLPVDFGERTELMVRLNPAVKALSDALGVPVLVSDVSVKGPRVIKPVAEVAPIAPHPEPQPEAKGDGDGDGTRRKRA